ncbi:unnamed protein product, partial [Didymodactylos carnosus]
NIPNSPVSLSKVDASDIIKKDICQKIKVTNIQLNIISLPNLVNEQIYHGEDRNHVILNDAKKENSNFRFYPDVTNAYDILNSIQSLCSNIKFEVKSKISDTLNDALNQMQGLIKSTNDQKQMSTIIVLTSEQNSADVVIERQKRALVDTNVVVSDDGCMFYADQLYLSDKNNPNGPAMNYSLDAQESNCIISNDPGSNNKSDVSARLLLRWKHNASMTFDTVLTAYMSGRYWFFDSITTPDNDSFRYFAYGMHDNMQTPSKYSYACNSATFVSFNNSKYVFQNRMWISNMQFQPFNVTTNNGTTYVFGPVNYCTSFFTAGIWMGIVSSLLCLAILMFGIYMMMSVTPPGRFDDPRGKPLQIKAQE